MTRESETQGLDPRAAVASNPFWYHTIEVAPGVTTPGWFDLWPIVDRLPWPDVRGKRCLDVGTADGFLAFELERRGAAEVVATDLSDHEMWDWPAHLRERGLEYLRTVAGPKKGKGLRIARELRGSSIELVEVSAYDLSPDSVGEFDIVVCGSLLLHLRDPLRALSSIRSVCGERFMSTNQIDLALTAFGSRAPLARLHGMTDECQWWVPNPLAHRQMLESIGFTIERETRPYCVPYGKAHTPRTRSPRSIARTVSRRVLTGGDGVPHHAVLAVP